MSELVDAIIMDDINLVETLLNNGADPNIRNNYGETALMVASTEGNTEIVELLLDRGANPFIRNPREQGALMIASEYGHTDIVRLLLDQGVDIDIQDDYGYTALNIAVQGNELLRLSDGRWVRPEAGDQGRRTEIVRLLLERGADPNIPDNEGHIALTTAERTGRTEIVRLIERHMDARKTQKAYQQKTAAQIPFDYEASRRIGSFLRDMPYNPGVTRRMREEEEVNERMADYLDTLAQYGGRRRRRRRRHKTMRKRYY